MTNKLDKIKSNIVKSAELISKSKKVVLMTGAGISVDSGIPTFQGTEGLWARFGKPKMNAFSEFIKKTNPKFVYFMIFRFAGGGGTPFAIQNLLPVLFNVKIQPVVSEEKEIFFRVTKSIPKPKLYRYLLFK